MIATYEIKVFRNVSDNHKFDRENTFNKIRLKRIKKSMVKN